MNVGKVSEPTKEQVFRKDLENQTYELFKSDPDNPELLQELRTLLEGHAQALMYMVLRKSDAAFVAEAANKVLLNLHTFEGSSQFSTWAHRVLMSSMYDQRRIERRRRDVPLTDALYLPAPSMEDVDFRLSVRTLLDDEEYALFQQIAVLGMTQREIAAELNRTQNAVKVRWSKVVRKLQDAFAK